MIHRKIGTIGLILFLSGRIQSQQNRIVVEPWSLITDFEPLSMGYYDICGMYHEMDESVHLLGSFKNFGYWQLNVDMYQHGHHFGETKRVSPLKGQGSVPIRCSSNQMAWNDRSDLVYFLDDGRVRVINGSNGDFLDTYVNHPLERATGGNTQQNIEFPCIATSLDGSYLVVVGGGSLDGLKNHWETWIFDLKTKEWASGPALNIPRANAACAVNQENGYLYILGGQNDAIHEWGLDSIEKLFLGDYDGIVKTFEHRWELLDTDTARLSQRKYKMQASFGVGSASSKLFIAGGMTGDKEANHDETRYTKTVDVFDTETETVTALPDMHVARRSAAVVAGQSGVWVFGGFNEEGGFLSSYEYLNDMTAEKGDGHVYVSNRQRNGQAANNNGDDDGDDDDDDGGAGSSFVSPSTPSAFFAWILAISVVTSVLCFIQCITLRNRCDWWKKDGTRTRSPIPDIDTSSGSPIERVFNRVKNWVVSPVHNYQQTPIVENDDSEGENLIDQDDKSYAEESENEAAGYSPTKDSPRRGRGLKKIATKNLGSNRPNQMANGSRTTVARSTRTPDRRNRTSTPQPKMGNH